jgi:hypothetical protein
MKKAIFLICISSAMLFLAACSTCKPVLYPNRHYNEVGHKQALKDIQVAIEIAKQSGLNDASASNRTLAKSATKTAASTGVSAAGSIAIGSITSGSAIGAGASGLSFLIDWMFTQKAPEPLFKKHVELTLRKQGYQVLGWK